MWLGGRGPLVSAPHQTCEGLSGQLRSVLRIRHFANCLLDNVNELNFNIIDIHYLSSIIDNSIVWGPHRQHKSIAGSNSHSLKSDFFHVTKSLCILPSARYRGLVPRVSDKTKTTGTIIVTMVEFEATCKI